MLKACAIQQPVAVFFFFFFRVSLLPPDPRHQSSSKRSDAVIDDLPTHLTKAQKFRLAVQDLPRVCGRHSVSGRATQPPFLRPWPFCIATHGSFFCFFFVFFILIHVFTYTMSRGGECFNKDEGVTPHFPRGMIKHGVSWHNTNRCSCGHSRRGTRSTQQLPSRLATSHDSARGWTWARFSMPDSRGRLPRWPIMT